MGEYRVTVYQDKKEEWRWLTIAGNGEPVSGSSEGYKNKAHAIDQAKALNPGIEIRVEEDAD